MLAVMVISGLKVLFFILVSVTVFRQGTAEAVDIGQHTICWTTQDNSQPQFDSGDSRPGGVEDAYLQGASSERTGLGKICGVEKEVKNG